MDGWWSNIEAIQVLGIDSRANIELELIVYRGHGWSYTQSEENIGGRHGKFQSDPTLWQDVSQNLATFEAL